MDIVEVKKEELGAFAAYVAGYTKEPVAQVERRYRYTWTAKRPNHGFMLVEEGRVRGALGALYSEREVGGARRRFCNLLDWYVDPDAAGSAGFLVMSLLARRETVFTSFTHTRHVARVLAGLRFQVVEHQALVTLALVHALRPSSSVRVLTGDDELRGSLAGPALTIYRDLKGARACRHLLLDRRGETSYCVVAVQRRRGVPVAVPLWVEDPGLFRAGLPAFSRWALGTLGTGLMMGRAGTFDRVPAAAVRVTDPRPPLYRGRDIDPAHIDPLYSELTT